MRNSPFDSIRNSALQLNASFSPTSDGSIVYSNAEYVARGSNGSLAHIPALITNVNDEGTLFIEPYSSIFPQGVTAENVTDFFVCSSGKATSSSTLQKFISIMTFLAQTAFDRRQVNIPVYRTRYFAVWQNLNPHQDDPNFGAYHGCDLPMVLGIYNDFHFGNQSATKNEKKLSLLYMNAWITFAEVGPVMSSP